jgi:hypothetical protein
MTQNPWASMSRAPLQGATRIVVRGRGRIRSEICDVILRAASLSRCLTAQHPLEPLQASQSPSPFGAYSALPKRLYERLGRVHDYDRAIARPQERSDRR